MFNLLCPVSYTGEFATISELETTGKQITWWQFGEPKGHANGVDFEDSLAHILAAGWVWASEQMKSIFEQDVILGGM